MLQILNKADFDRLCTVEGFTPIRRAMSPLQDAQTPVIGRVEPPTLNPLDVLFTRQKWHERGLI